MRKLKLWIVFAILITCLFSTIKTVFSEDIELNNLNKSVVQLIYKWTYWYWVFFLWNTTSVDETELTINNWTTTYSIKCYKQLKWYYTNNFLNFKMFPIDDETHWSNIINFTWWLYTNCKNGDEQYNGIYWHIQWTYKSWSSNVENMHEIRAWLKWEWSDLQWSSDSPLKLIQNSSSIALSGHFWDYLAKDAIAITYIKEWIYIDYPDDYFTGTDTFSGNQNEIYFNDSWNDWFGLFFLWTWIENWPYEITDKYNTTLSCSWQLNWYYSFSFNDFGMLPLDSGTESQRPTTWIDYITWWLYYNCRNISNNKIYTWVYWYIKRDYNYGNIHEIRAWMTSNGKFINNSPIELIYSDNFRNINRTLSWQYHDNLAKNSKTDARLFGDLGIIIDWTEYKATWTLDDPYIILPYESYKNAKMYIKSSKENTFANLKLTEFDNNSQETRDYYNNDLDNERSNFWFYWYHDNISFSQEESLKSWTITLTLTNNENENETWTQTIRFEIADPVITIPNVTIHHVPECSTWITVTATVTVTNYPTFEWNIWYAFTNWNNCNNITVWTPYTLWDIINIPEDWNVWEFICFMAENEAGTWFDNWQITWIDFDWPTFTLVSWSWEECKTWKVHIEGIEQVWCASGNIKPISWELPNWSTEYELTAYSGWIWNKIVTWYVQDELWNYNYKTGEFSWSNTSPSIQTWTLIYPNIITWTIIPTTLYTNLIESMWVIDWLCWNDSINKTWTITCDYTSGDGNWSAGWNWDGIDVTPPTNGDWTWTCTVRFTDDEWTTISWTVIYKYDTLPPHIEITWPDPACSISKTVTWSISNNEAWTLWYSTWQDINSVCYWTMTTWTSVTFDKESDSGTYVCFKAMDLYGNISFATSTVITNIDRTPPTYQITTSPDVLYECETWTITINFISDWPCAWLNTTGYKFGNQPWWTINTYSTGRDKTWTLNINTKIKDSLGNETWQTVTLQRNDRPITGLTLTWIWDLSEDYVGNPIEMFEITWQWDCEYIQVYTNECINAIQILSWSQDNYTLTIKPNENTDSPWECTILFTDWDTIITWTIKFTVKTKEYFIVLDKTWGIETWELKILPENANSYIDTWKVSAALVVNDNIVPFANDVIRINSINFSSRNNIGNTHNWLRSAIFDVDLNIEIDKVDDEYKCECDTWYFAIIFETWFVTDPAWNPSEKSEIESNNIYVAGNYLIIESWDDRKTQNSTWIRSWFILTGYLKGNILTWTSSITCSDPYGTCSGFSCNEIWVTSVRRLSEPPAYFDIKLFGKTYKAPFYYVFNLKIDPIPSLWNQTIWTWCKIEINEPCYETNKWCSSYSFTEINIDLIKRPIKAWRIWSENYRESTLLNAINEWSWDNWFLFFITNPQDLKSWWALWTISYTINFSEPVADEFYYITWSAIVNWFKEDLNIKRPTFNYENPRNYLFRFPEY